MSPLLLVSILLAAEPAADAPPPVVVTEGLMGRTASTACGRETYAPPRLYTMATELTAWPDAVRIDAGNLLGASTVGNLTLKHDLPGFVGMLRSLRYRAVALGSRDLAMARPRLLEAGRALEAGGLPFLATNLRCDEKAQAVCDVTRDAADPPWIVETRAGRVAVIAALAPDALTHVAPDRATGLRLDPPGAALAAAATKARKLGARWVVAVVSGARDGELVDALEVAGVLGRETQPPDVLVAVRVSARLLDATTPSGVRVVASHRGHAVQVLPERTPAPPRPEVEPPFEVERWSESLGETLCQVYAQGERWPLSKPLDEEALFERLMDALRARAGAEVAVLNRGTLDTDGPLRGSMTRLDVIEMLPFDNAVERANVPGSVLKQYVEQAAAQPTLRVRGATRGPDGKVTVNGRPLDESQRYRVVTNDFLATGGDGVMTDSSVTYETLGRTSVRDVWLEWLSHPSRRDRIAEVPPLDLAQHTRWVFRTAIDASFSSVRVVNPSPTVFNDTQLSRANAIAFRADSELRADADHPDYTLENGLRLRYGVARTANPDGSAPPIAETDDLIALRDTAVYRRWGNSTARWYIPVLFGESYLEAEFTRPATRNYRHLEWRPIAGLRFPLMPELSLFFGGGLDWETLNRAPTLPSGEPTAAAVVVGGALLRPRRLFVAGPVAVEGEGSLDVSWRDPARTSTALVRLHAKLSIPILRTLSLTLSYDLFARHVDPALLPSAAQVSRGWSFSGDAVVGLGFRWIEPLQAFAN